MFSTLNEAKINHQRNEHEFTLGSCLGSGAIDRPALRLTRVSCKHQTFFIIKVTIISDKEASAPRKLTIFNGQKEPSWAENFVG